MWTTELPAGSLGESAGTTSHVVPAPGATAKPTAAPEAHGTLLLMLPALSRTVPETACAQVGVRDRQA